jgi:hypothetical protein
MIGLGLGLGLRQKVFKSMLSIAGILLVGQAGHEGSCYYWSTQEHYRRDLKKGEFQCYQIRLNMQRTFQMDTKERSMQIYCREQ